MELQELSYDKSRELISIFESLEEPSVLSTDWVDVHEPRASYIWLLEGINQPLGFLSYRVLILPNRIDFVYIVKIYALKTHRGRNPTLVEEERVSEILFREIDKKNVNILTLESACENLDRYYEELGFEYNKEISEAFAHEIGTSEQIRYRKKEASNREVSDEMKELFGI